MYKCHMFKVKGILYCQVVEDKVLAVLWQLGENYYST